MQVRVQRAVDKWIGVPLCALLSLIERFRPARKPALPVQKILVILLSEMGSLVLAYPMFAWLKERYPGASIHMLMFAKNREALDLMDVIPRENILTLDDGSAQTFVAESARMIPTLRAHGFDAVIDCELFTRISSLFAYLSNAPLRVGFHPQTQEGLYRGSFINRPVIYNPYRHLSLQLLTMAGAIESDTRPLAKFPLLPPRLTPPQVPLRSQRARRNARPFCRRLSRRRWAVVSSWFIRAAASCRFVPGRRPITNRCASN